MTTATETDPVAEFLSITGDILRAVGRSLRWTWTAGELVLGGDHARKRARARRRRIAIQAAARRRQQATEWQRQLRQAEAAERQAARTAAKPEPATKPETKPESQPTTTRQEPAGHSPTDPQKVGTGTNPDTPPYAQARRAGATHRQETTVATGEAGTYEETLASFNAVIDTCRLALVAVESMTGGLEAQEVPLPDGLTKVIDLLGSAQIELDHSRTDFQQKQGAILEAASAAGGMGNRAFYPGAA